MKKAKPRESVSRLSDIEYCEILFCHGKKDKSMEKQGGALHSYLVDLLRRQLIARPCLSMDKSNRIVGQCVKCLFRPYVYERDGQADPAQCQAQRLPYRALGWRGYQSGGESLRA